MTAAAHPAKTVSAQPGFWVALRGLWLMDWQSRLTWRRLPTLLASIFALPALAYATTDPGRLSVYSHWLFEFYLLLVLPLHCLSICGGMIRDELHNDTLGFIITRPLTRTRLILLKYITHVSWVQMIALGNGLLLFAVGLTLHEPRLAKLALIFFPTQFLAVLAYGALSALLGLINKRYMVLGIVYGFVVEVGIGRIPTNMNSLSMANHVRTLLANSAFVDEFYSWSPEHTLFSIGALLVATALFLTLAALLFTWREYHATEEMQK